MDVHLLHHWRSASAASCRSLGHPSPQRGAVAPYWQSSRDPLHNQQHLQGLEWRGSPGAGPQRPIHAFIDSRRVSPPAQHGAGNGRLGCNTCNKQTHPHNGIGSIHHATRPPFSWTSTAVQPCHHFLVLFGVSILGEVHARHGQVIAVTPADMPLQKSFSEQNGSVKVCRPLPRRYCTLKRLVAGITNLGCHHNSRVRIGRDRRLIPTQVRTQQPVEARRTPDPLNPSRQRLRTS